MFFFSRTLPSFFLIIAIAATSLVASASNSAAQDSNPQAAPSAPDENKNSQRSDEKPSAKTDTQSEAKKEADAPTNTVKPAEEKTKTLTIASWGGAYQQAQDFAYFIPFQERHHIMIKALSHKGDFSGLAEKLKTEPAAWDILDLSPKALEQACKAGLLAEIDPKLLPPAPNGTIAQEDYLSNGLHKCGVASVAWSSLILADKQAFKKRSPKSLADFFDVKKFPGKRGMKAGAQYNLELALLADGVPSEEIYARLATQEGVSQALAKLQTIKDHIVWWKSGAEPFKLMDEGSIVMTTAYSGRAFRKVLAQNKAYHMIWDGQIYQADFWAIAKNTPHKEAALKYIAFASQPQNIAYNAQWLSYGPMRVSAIDMVKKHPEIGIDIKPFMPTLPVNMKNALYYDSVWWAKHISSIETQFKTWLSAAPVEQKPDEEGAKKSNNADSVRKKK